MTHKFQKLNIDLPRQPLSDQKIWAVIGWFLAAIIIMIIAISYVSYLNNEADNQGKAQFETSAQEYFFIDPLMHLS